MIFRVKSVLRRKTRLNNWPQERATFLEGKKWVTYLGEGLTWSLVDWRAGERARDARNEA